MAVALAYELKDFLSIAATAIVILTACAGVLGYMWWKVRTEAQLQASESYKNLKETAESYRTRLTVDDEELAKLKEAHAELKRDCKRQDEALTVATKQLSRALAGRDAWKARAQFLEAVHRAPADPALAGIDDDEDGEQRNG
jgi:hypothetical protein